MSDTFEDAFVYFMLADGVGRPIGPCHDGRARVGVAGVQVGRCRSSTTQCSVVLSRLVPLRWPVFPLSLSVSP